MDAASDVERNKQVVRDQIAAMARRDGAAQGLLMTDDVQWWVPQSAVDASGLARPLSGGGVGTRRHCVRIRAHGPVTRRKATR